MRERRKKRLKKIFLREGEGSVQKGKFLGTDPVLKELHNLLYKILELPHGGRRLSSKEKIFRGRKLDENSESFSF